MSARPDRLGRLAIDPDDDLADPPAPSQPPPAAAAVDPARWSSALDDPAIVAGRRAFRSFYVDDETFARFRAAVHWSARREDAGDDVPENMSVAVAAFMAATAADLEARYNAGAPFRPTPEQRKAARRRRA